MSGSLPHVIARALLSWAVLAAVAAAAQEPPAPLPIPGDPSPAFRADPRAPGPDRTGEPIAPAGGRIDRDSFVADRFLAEGQRASHGFEARAGELALFELITYGYERGWQSAAEVVVHAPDGSELARARAEGGAAYRLFLPCLARADGEYRLELIASKQFFRYTLVRNSRFQTHDASATYSLERREQLFDWLADARDEVRYSLDVAAGERVGLRVLSASEALRRQVRQARRALLEGGAEAGAAAGADGAMAERMGRGGAMSSMQGARAGADAPWSPVLEASIGGEALAEAGTWVRFVAPRAGFVDLRVRSGGGEAGGIYELVIERDLPLVHVNGAIADGEGDSVALARIALYREPELDWMGTAESRADGGYEIDVPAGQYTVLVTREGLARPIVVRTAIEEDRELNAIVGGGR